MSETPLRRVVYTAVMGRYEQLNDQPVAAETGIEFICFTDDPELTSATWSVRVVAPRFEMDPIRSARYLKVCGPELLDGYDQSLWIDNSVKLRVPPEKLFDEWLGDAEIAVPRHSYRASVVAEFDAVVASGYDDPARVYEQLIHYSTLRPAALDEVPFWTALMARQRNSQVDRVMRLWWDHLLRYSRRDQLSFNFVIGASGVSVLGIEMDNQSSEWHEWPVRVDRNWERTGDRMANALRIPLVEIGRLQNALDGAAVQMSKLESEIERLQLESDAEEVKAAVRLEEQKSRVQHSFESTVSWKVTAPLRSIRRQFHR